MVVTPTKLVTLVIEQECLDRLAATQTGGVGFSDIARQLDAENFPETVGSSRISVGKK